jgi:undecaprenyl-phosphate 4-deoxy-4-formamido-L-arabinose transferase
MGKPAAAESESMNSESISVVIPVYNSRATLAALCLQLKAVLSTVGRAYEIILVNDGSPDGSWDVIQELAEQQANVIGIDLTRNYGQHNALLCGIRAAQHSVVVTMDDDLQHPPSQIPLLLNKLAEGHDVVYGVPQRERHGWWRDGSSIVTKLALHHIMGAATARKVSAFRAFRTYLRDAFAAYRSPFISVDVLLSWATTRFAAVAVQHEPRRVGQSHYTLRKLIVHALNMATGFSTLPLQFASLIGFVFTCLGLMVFAVVCGRYLIQGSSVPGFPFLASIIAIFSGTQLFALGIIGEYLARMHFRMMGRPAYTVRARLSPGGHRRHNRLIRRAG